MSLKTKFERRAPRMLLVVLLAAGAAAALTRGAAGVDAQSSPTRALGGTPGRARQPASGTATFVSYFPVVGKAPLDCPLTGEAYGTVAVLSAPTDPAAEVNPDINLSLRGYAATTGTLGLVDIATTPDSNAPLLYHLFADNRVPTFNAVDQVYDWDWECNCRGALIAEPAVTLAYFKMGASEPVCAPGSGYDIGRRPMTGYSMMVLYASTSRITLKYTREDNVVSGYTLHIENINVDSSLLSLYQQMNNGGRSRLPALYGGQPIGTPIGSQIGVAIRDTGTFLDPRSHYDWWQGK